MTLGDVLALSDRQERLLTRILQILLLGLVCYGLVTGQLGMAINGGVAFGLTLLPGLLRREYGYSIDAGLALWITVAVFLHSVGSLGPYRWFGWYDSITHTVSATVIAGFGYAGFRAFERHSEHIDVPDEFRAVFIVVFVLAAGVLWEILEFASELGATVVGVRPPLVVYGVDDIVHDLTYNLLGAAVVALWGTRYVRGLASFFSRRLRSHDGEVDS